MVAQRPRRQQVAILGGGMGGLAAAFRLTQTPEQRARTAVTVYQPGWRLGGKGASVRSPTPDGRIEEHGLHLLMGHYDTVFSLLRDCYDELGRAPGAPLATLDEALSPWDHIVVAEPPAATGEGWAQWRFTFPRNSDRPGVGGPVPSLRACAENLLGACDLIAGFEQEPGVSDPQRRLLRGLSGTARWVRDTPHGRRRLKRAVGLLGTVLRGMVRDGVLRDGFSAIDDEDLRDWLRRHGASEALLASAGPKVMYDLLFARAGGDPAAESIAAGVAIRFALRMGFAYKGAIFWTMNAGMGEVVFAPLYEVLRRRGVRFAFFHRAEHLSLSADGRRIEGITLTRQARPRSGAYAPLVDADGLPAWPAAPLRDQLHDGETLAGLDLMDPGVVSPTGETVRLRAGAHFDAVILAVPPAASAGMLSEVRAAHPRWEAMLSCVTHNATFGVQLWLSRPLEALGWTGDRPAMTSYIEPLNTYAELSHLLPRERWAAGARSLAYFCAPLPEGRDLAWLKAQTRRWLCEAGPDLWPEAVTEDGAFDWSILVDPEGREGPARLEAQFFTCNTLPADRYVLSEPGSIRARLGADETGVENLLVAGDWTDSGLSCGSIESAARSGVLCAEATERSLKRRGAWHGAR